MTQETPEENPYTKVLNFWFSPPTSPSYLHPKPFWYSTTPADDALVRTHLSPLYESANSKALDAWITEDTGLGALALIILLDQVPRSIFRNTPQAYATDAKAVAVARYAVSQGWDEHLPGIQRRYMYSPFNHSERLEDQEMSVRLSEGLGDERHLDWARRFCEMIRREGRFVHRDGVLGR